MIRSVCFCLILACGTALPRISAEPAYRLEVLKQTSLYDPVFGGLVYRFVACPDGKTVLVNYEGSLTIVDPDGAVLHERFYDELDGASAVACTPDDRLLVGARGRLKVFSMTPRGLELERSQYISGAALRIQPTPTGDVYVVGLAKLDNRRVLLRRHRLADGKFLDAPELDLPYEIGPTLNSLTMHGGVFWHAGRREAIFYPANPAQFWCFDEQGELAAVETPTGLGFRNEFFTDHAPARPIWHDYDWIRNAVPLPDGRIVAQIYPGRRHVGRPEPGVNLARLAVMDAEFRVLSENLKHNFLGLLAGADAEGNLYFMDLVVNQAARWTKARVRP